jgi:hypothetical protein
MKQVNFWVSVYDKKGDLIKAKEQRFLVQEIDTVDLNIIANDYIIPQIVVWNNLNPEIRLEFLFIQEVITP